MAKPKPMVDEQYNGMQIAVACTISSYYLIVDGVVRDTFKGLMTSASFQLKCEINGVKIVADFKMQVCGITLFLYCDDKLIAKKWQL